MSCLGCAKRRQAIKRGVEDMAKKAKEVSENLKKRAARRKHDALIDELTIKIKTAQQQLADAKAKRKAGVL